jgi:DNA modification methylase
MLKPYFETENGKLYHGDCFEVIKQLPDNHVQCVVTSPPYWGLRDYGTATWESGNLSCNHICGNQIQDNKAIGAITSGVRPGNDSSTCKKCGAKRIDKQIGLEKIPEEYVEKLVILFQEVRRVLKDNGILWLNLGDSYSGSTGQTGGIGLNTYQKEAKATDKMMRSANVNGMKPKDLVGIPWTVALALRADGWYLRQDPMPESVTDRCTKAHEYIFLLSKNKRYYYDAEGIKERSKNPFDNRAAREKLYGQGDLHISRLNPKSAKSYTNANKRSVWSINTQPFPEAHFATFPPDLIEPCILAGSAKGNIIFDPFMGAGTTAIVAEKWNRQWIGIELNGEYCEIAKKRIIRETRQLTIC